MALSQEHLREAAEAMVVGLAQTGDRAAFAELVRRRGPWLRNLMRRFSGDAVLADDLAQEVFLQAWRKLGSLNHADRFGGWLKQIAVNVWLQYLRKQDALREAVPEDEALPAPLSAPGGLRVDLDRALATLSPPARLCIVLNYHEGMSHGEIAAATGMAVGTVKSHIKRGSEKLKVLLNAYQEVST